MMSAVDDTLQVTRQNNHNDEFVRQYIAARKKEQRLYTNYELLQLPNVPTLHPLLNEWQLRKKSAGKLKAYLLKKKKSLNILEVGCGNGWLSAALAAINNSTIVGIDINEVELTQASQVFQHIKNLSFISTTISDKRLVKNSFDVIVFAASIQYFTSLTETITQVLDLLKSDGEIHIIDTHFYKTNEVNVAASRTKDYYASLGCNGMNNYYFHHTLEDLEHFHYEVVFAPTFIQKNIFQNRHPFHWIKINGKA